MKTIKVEPYTDATVSPSTGVTQLFGILKGYLQLSGYYYQVDAKGGKFASIRQALLILYCGFCNFSAIFNACRFIFVFGNVSKYSSNILTSIAYASFYAEVACLSVTMTLSLRNNFKQLALLFKSRYEQHSSCNPRLKVITHTLFCICLLLGLLLDVGRLILHETVWADTPKHDVPFDQLDQSYQNIGRFLDVAISLVGSMGFYAMIIVYNVISYIIFKEFSLYSSKFKTLYNGPKDELDLKFQELWDDHVSDCDLLQQAEKFLKHFIFITYFSAVPIFCFLLYGLIKGQLPVDEFGFVAAIFIFCILQIANITLVGVFINEKAHEPLQHIFHAKWTSLSEETMQKISLFVTRLSADKIGYSAYGLFTIDRSTILMVCGTILTYAVVVLQLQTDTDSSCHENILKNINITQLCP